MWGNRIRAAVVALTLVVAACSDSSPPDPTLASGTTVPETTTTVATTSTTTTTTTTAAPTTTTTRSPDERLTEIEALAKDAIMGRLQAIHDEDFDALLFWAGSQKSYDDGITAMDRTNYLQRPSWENFSYGVEEVFLDRHDCVVTRDALSVTDGVIEGIGESTSVNIRIWWPADDGRFQHGAIWQDGTPQVQWIEECDLAQRGVTP